MSIELRTLDGGTRRIDSGAIEALRGALRGSLLEAVDAAADAAQIAWVRSLWEALEPWSSSAVYMNVLGEGEGEDRVRAAYGPNYARLAAVKAKYDPKNLFRLNQNVRPLAAAAS